MLPVVVLTKRANMIGKNKFTFSVVSSIITERENNGGHANSGHNQNGGNNQNQNGNSQIVVDPNKAPPNVNNQNINRNQNNYKNNPSTKNTKQLKNNQSVKDSVTNPVVKTEEAPAGRTRRRRSAVSS